ncbi:hypothetical protein HID58_005844 [Brassica napus]|uniref:Uncharacterized protein n=1 Tax=Brassica napus TaxID=3708 RepID=A0ABQ8E9P7_BRANA|nr:hypothetical protein HID58_005844 [Brassica napus]
MNQPSSGLTPQEESNTTHQVLATETETLEKATETNSPENSVTAAVQPEVTPEEHYPPKVTETKTASTKKKETSKKEEAAEEDKRIPQNLGSFKEESSKHFF